MKSTGIQWKDKLHPWEFTLPIPRNIPPTKPSNLTVEIVSDSAKYMSLNLAFKSLPSGSESWELNGNFQDVIPMNP